MVLNQDKIFTIEDCDFLNDFYKQIKIYANEFYNETNKAIAKDENNFLKAIFTPKETVIFIILNDALFQAVFGFVKLIDERLPIPAFNSLRASIEVLRIIRAYFSDKDFREQYVNNDNYDILHTADYKFMQGKINKVLENYEIELKRKFPNIAFLRPSNYDLIKDSALSNLHSELSKWSHMLNVNLIAPPSIEEGRIYMGRRERYTDKMQFHIRKYIEGLYWILSYHNGTLTNLRVSNDFLQHSVDICELYGEFIKKVYTKDKK